MAVPRLSTSSASAAQELAALLRGLLAHERDVVTDFLLYLGEFDRRGFALALGYGSLFEYCTRGLGLSGSAAYRRIASARLLRRFPAMEPLLRDGRLSPTTVTLLKDVLDEANHRDLLGQAAGLTKEQVAALVAVLRPRAATRDAVRPLPPALLVALPASALPDRTPAPTRPSPASGAPPPAPAPALVPVPVPGPSPRVLVAVQPIPPPRVESISADLRVLKVTVSKEFLDELDEVKAALSHSVPSGRFEDVVRECFRRVLAGARSKRGAVAAAPASRAVAVPAATPAATPAPSGAVVAATPAAAPAAARAVHATAPPAAAPAASRAVHATAPPAAAPAASRAVVAAAPEMVPPATASAGPQPAVAARSPAKTRAPARRAAIPAELERQVRQRDGHRCAVVGPDGRMCGSRYRLELHHRRAVARGGETSLDNLMLVCRRHNDWLARLEFGERHMARCRERPRAPAIGRGADACSSSAVLGGSPQPPRRLEARPAPDRRAARARACAGATCRAPPPRPPRPPRSQG
jgi:hypothetical protein